ncbi:hypothetical protein [Phenylobacterium sp.]|uniref:hypothetical protein n=1 Tax=Phenylobacterium sp. TaxID=1871053 RepID=UPI0027308591|nr:hypothetical protein [Phenylobacterium sp.]MDP1619091.1 hypothetical protein [Phenylobacterium sp.]MDP1986198.1 hypothetical protein [Phenylobacterium sp.]
MRTVVLLGFCMALGAGAAQACDMHGDLYSPMTAYFSYRDMTPEQRRDADNRAHEAMRERDMANARAALLSRFAIKVERSPDAPQLASADTNQSRASSAR